MSLLIVFNQGAGTATVGNPPVTEVVALYNPLHGIRGKRLQPATETALSDPVEEARGYSNSPIAVKGGS